MLKGDDIEIFVYLYTRVSSNNLTLIYNIITIVFKFFKIYFYLEKFIGTIFWLPFWNTLIQWTTDTKYLNYVTKKCNFIFTVIVHPYLQLLYLYNFFKSCLGNFLKLFFFKKIFKPLSKMSPIKTVV